MSRRPFSENMVQDLTRSEMSQVSRDIEPQVGWLVDFLLKTPADGLVLRTHSSQDAGALAVRAIELNVGQKFPVYDRPSPSYKTEQIGETDIIKPSDLFVVAGGPLSTAGGFTTVFHRAETFDLVDSSTRTRLSVNDFSGVPLFPSFMRP